MQPEIAMLWVPSLPISKHGMIHAGSRTNVPRCRCLRFVLPNVLHRVDPEASIDQHSFSLARVRVEVRLKPSF